MLVPYRGPVKATMEDMLGSCCALLCCCLDRDMLAQTNTGGMRSACTYVGAAILKDFSKRTTFIRVTAQTNETFASACSLLLVQLTSLSLSA